jgi:hypothetical protein
MRDDNPFDLARPRLKPSKPATGTPVTQMAGLGGTATEQEGRAELVTLVEEIG